MSRCTTSVIWSLPRVCALFAAAMGADVLAAAESSAASPGKPPLSRAAIEQLVIKQLQKVPGYEPGDLLSRKEIEPILNELADRGYLPPDPESAMRAYLPETSPLVQVLRTPRGIEFMRAVGRQPEAYDRLERLSWSKIGRGLLADMVNSPDGKRAFEHMSSPAGAKLVESMLTGDTDAETFRLPTGKVHTANELVEQLVGLYGPN
ncbi:MAG: hypothetical protein JNL96_23715 [Planctomycetaceae bacterium]|nr:hypothetical protein [Planctomycetaceae bacterium]